MPTWLPLPGFLDLIDILLVAVAGWIAIATLRRTRARNALVGLAVVTLVYGVAQALDFRLTATLIQGFFAVAVLVLVVIFQEDLRRFFDGIGGWRPGRPPLPTNEHDSLVRAVIQLASSRTGALIVLPGEERLERYLTGGIELHGRVSEPLLLSIFDASSPGHDGAVLVNGDLIERFAVHLPLSANRELLGTRGTRHAAALGLAEFSDALVIAVSEERGTVAVAQDGELHLLEQPTDLIGLLAHRRQNTPVEESFLQRRGFRDAAIAVVGALVLWMFLVPGSEVAEASFDAPVVLSNLPQDLEFEGIEPETVRIVLRGQRRDLMIAERDRVSVHLDAYLAKFGRRTFTVMSDSVEKPAGLSVITIAPEKVRLSLQAIEAGRRTGDEGGP